MIFFFLMIKYPKIALLVSQMLYVILLQLNKFITYDFSEYYYSSLPLLTLKMTFILQIHSLKYSIHNT